MEFNKGLMNIIGFTGKKGVGKNFIAEIAKTIITDCYSEPTIDKDHSPYPGKKLLSGGRVEFAAFADPMKEFIVNVLGVSPRLIYGNDKDKNTPTQYSWENMPKWLQEKFNKHEGAMTIRHVLQVYGTELNREIWDKEIWVKAMGRRINTAQTKWFFVTDVRYQNEIELIQQKKGKIWRINGPQRGDEAVKNDGHSSEIVMDFTTNFDYIIENTLEDTPESLRNKVADGLQRSFGDFRIHHFEYHRRHPTDYSFDGESREYLATTPKEEDGSIQ